MALNLFKHLMPAEEALHAAVLRAGEVYRAGGDRAAADDRRRHPGGQQHVATIREIEMAADAVARKIFIGANRTFNAPIDREDILALAHVLDDCVDLIEDTAKGILRYGVREFPAEMRAMADAVVEAAAVLQKVMPFLDSVSKDHKTIAALCEQVGQIEGRADASFDARTHALAGAAAGRRDRHDRLHRPQGALRARRGCRRQVRRRRQRHPDHHREARMTQPAYHERCIPAPTDVHGRHRARTPRPHRIDRGRAAVRLPQRSPRRGQLDRDGRGDACPAAADRGDLGRVLQFHRLRGIRAARGANGRHGHRERRRRGRQRHLRRVDRRHRLERRDVEPGHSVQQQPCADRRA